MNKFFEFKEYSERQSNRPYYRGVWERLQMEAYRMLPFQIPVNSSDYTLYQVVDGVETDITSELNGITLTSDYLSYDGSNLDSMLTNGACYFKLVNGSDWYYSEDCHVGYVNMFIQFDGRSFYIDDGDLYYSNKLIANVGDVVSVVIDSDIQDPQEIDVTIEYDSGTTQIIGGLTQVDITTYSGVSTESGMFSIKIENRSGYDYVVNNCDVSLGYSDKMIQIKVSSSVDFGGVKYTDGWEQWMYKAANVRRSPNVDIEKIGDEHNGEIIIEKSVSAIRNVIRMKVTEQEFEALVHGVSGTIEITDQTGKVYNAINVELSQPDWYQGNGICEMSFIDENNINVFTLNNSAI